MRTKNVIRNTLWELLYEFVVVILAFLAPRFIIISYGSQVNGLQATITQIISIMTLLQAGAITASIYSLYKPIAENNYDEISSKLSSSVKYFKKIGYIFLFVMFTGAIITASILKTEIDRNIVLFAFNILGLKSSLDLFFTSRFRILFSATQQKHIISIALLIEQFIYYSLIFIIILFKLHFIYIYLSLLFGCMIKIILLHAVFSRLYGKLITTSKMGVKTQIVGKNYSLINEISHSIVASSIMILISFLYGLEAASVFGVYWMVIRLLTMLAQAIYGSFAPSFGNLIAEGNYKKATDVFELFQYIFTTINTLFYMSAAYMILPFVRIYTSGITDAQYVNQFLSIIIILYGIIYTYRIPYNIVVSTNGLFKETWMQPLISSLLSLILSIVLGKREMVFILIGPLTFYITNVVYQHFRLKKVLPQLRIIKAKRHFFISLIGIVMAITLSIFYPSTANNIREFIFDSVIAFIVSALIITFFSLMLDKKSLFSSIKYIKIVVLRRLTI